MHALLLSQRAAGAGRERPADRLPGGRRQRGPAAVLPLVDPRDRGSSPARPRRSRTRWRGSARSSRLRSRRQPTRPSTRTSASPGGLQGRGGLQTQSSSAADRSSSRNASGSIPGIPRLAATFVIARSSSFRTQRAESSTTVAGLTPRAAMAASRSSTGQGSVAQYLLDPRGLGAAGAGGPEDVERRGHRADPRQRHVRGKVRRPAASPDDSSRSRRRR